MEGCEKDKISFQYFVTSYVLNSDWRKPNHLVNLEWLYAPSQSVNILLQKI